MPVEAQSRQTQKSQPPRQSPPTEPPRPVEAPEPTGPVRSVVEWPDPDPDPVSASASVQLALFPPDRVRVRRPRRASAGLVSPAATPALAGVGGAAWWVFVLVEALFPGVADGSCPRLVMGLAAVVVLVCGAGLVSAASGTPARWSGVRR